jgi:hypothetical protein
MPNAWAVRREQFCVGRAAEYNTSRGEIGPADYVRFFEPPDTLRRIPRRKPAGLLETR